MILILIRIKNFMCIEDLTLDLQSGFTVITGPTNNGKSALLKALSSLFYNTHSDSRVKNGKDYYVIGVKDGEYTVMAKRNPSKGAKTTYQVNGNNLTKVGRGSIPEVEEVTDIKEIDILQQKVALNFFQQFSYPFLLDKTPSQLYDFLASSESSNTLSDVVKQMKSDLKEIQDSEKRLEGSIDMVKSSYEKDKVKLSNLQGCLKSVDDILMLSGEAQSFDRLSILNDSLYNLSQQYNSLESSYEDVCIEYSKFSRLDDLYELYQDNLNLKDILIRFANLYKEGKDFKDKYKIYSNIDFDYYQRLEEIYNIYSKDKEDLLELEKLISRFTSLNSDLNSYNLQSSLLNPILESINNIENLESEYKVVSDLVNLYDSSSSILSSQNNKLQEISNRIIEVDNELSTFKECPYCGSNLGGV